MSTLKKSANDEKKLYFPEGALLNMMDVAVVESERRKSEYIKEPFTVYLVESRPVENATSFHPGSALWRRYSEFDLLRNYLMATYPYIVMPPLPEKRVLHFQINVEKLQIATDKFEPDFVERRRQGLECFLLRLSSHPVISQDSIFRAFLSQEEGWKDSVMGTQWQQKVDNRLKSLTASMIIKHNDKQFENIKSYCDSLNTNIAALLKVQQRISDRSAALTKRHSEYGKLLSEWSGMETEMGDVLQQAGHQMDRLAAQTTAILNEEEVAYTDQLKEYLYFTDSLRAIVRKQNLRQWELERGEESLSDKSRQKEELIKEIQILEEGGELPPPTGLKTVQKLIFGDETLEQKQVKVLTLEEATKEAETMVETAQVEVSEFTEKSLKDFERFKKQKVRDINEIMENYIKTQIKVNKLGLQQWQTMKEYFQSMK